MRKAVVFDDFSYQCSYFTSETDINNGYGCTHPDNEKESGEDIARCYCHTCPLGLEAEQEDISDPVTEIDWDGLCEDGEVLESEYLLVDIGNDATAEQKEALHSYDRYMHRYDKKWLDENNIPNQLRE